VNTHPKVAAATATPPAMEPAHGSTRNQAAIDGRRNRVAMMTPATKRIAEPPPPKWPLTRKSATGNTKAQIPSVHKLHAMNSERDMSIAR